MNSAGLVVLISADAEWLAVRRILGAPDLDATPLGETFLFDLQGREVRFFHGGWGKIAAAASTQYIIDHYQPELLVNLGTCGGVEGRIERGAILEVNRTIVYDIQEEMGDPQAAIDHYSSRLFAGDRMAEVLTRHGIQSGLLVSADRDLQPGELAGLVERFGAVAGDWESGAIAWVAARNKVPCLIVRGVTDLVGATGGEAYGDPAYFMKQTRSVMERLLGLLPDILGDLGRSIHIRDDPAKG